MQLSSILQMPAFWLGRARMSAELAWFRHTVLPKGSASLITRWCAERSDGQLGYLSYKQIGDLARSINKDQNIHPGYASASLGYVFESLARAQKGSAGHAGQQEEKASAVYNTWSTMLHTPAFRALVKPGHANAILARLQYWNLSASYFSGEWSAEVPLTGAIFVRDCLSKLEGAHLLQNAALVSDLCASVPPQPTTDQASTVAELAYSALALLREVSKSPDTALDGLPHLFHVISKCGHARKWAEADTAHRDQELMDKLKTQVQDAASFMCVALDTITHSGKRLPPVLHAKEESWGRIFNPAMAAYNRLDNDNPWRDVLAKEMIHCRMATPLPPVERLSQVWLTTSLVPELSQENEGKFSKEVMAYAALCAERKLSQVTDLDKREYLEDALVHAAAKAGIMPVTEANPVLETNSHVILRHAPDPEQPSAFCIYTVRCPGAHYSRVPAHSGVWSGQDAPPVSAESLVQNTAFVNMEAPFVMAVTAVMHRDLVVLRSCEPAIPTRPGGFPTNQSLFRQAAGIKNPH